MPRPLEQWLTTDISDNKTYSVPLKIKRSLRIERNKICHPGSYQITNTIFSLYFCNWENTFIYWLFYLLFW